MSKLRFINWFISISKNVRFRLRDRLIYTAVLCFCLGGLIFPLLPASTQTTVNHPGCAFKLITAHPCPSCGYSRSVQHAIQGELHEAFLFNPFTPFYAWLMLSMTVLAALSLLKRQHFNFSKPMLIIIFGIIIVSWIVKFIIGVPYY